MGYLALSEIENFIEYVQSLAGYKDGYIICASAKDSLHGINNEAIIALNNVGMKNIPTGWNGYVFLMESGKVYIDKGSDKKIPLVERVCLKNSDWQIISKPWNAGNKAGIIVNEIDLAVNSRGLNIVVINSRTREVVDSVCFDFFPDSKQPCIHKTGLISVFIPSKRNIEKNGYDINEKLNNIIKKYDLAELYPRYYDVNVSKKIIRDLSDEWNETNSIACIVLGENNDKMYRDEENFLSSLNMYKKNQIDFYRCEIKKNDFAGMDFQYKRNWLYNFNSLKAVKWNGYSHIYIISNQGEYPVGMWLKENNIRYESLSDILYSRGVKYIPADTEYYEFIADRKKIVDESPVIWEYYEQKSKYHVYSSKELQNVCAKKCFFLALVMKNFLSAKEWLEIMQENDDCKKYRTAWKEIQKLLDEIKYRLKKRKKRDIISVWVDHTLYEDLYLMPFVSSLRNSSIWFENIITLTGFTRETMRGLFTGKKLIDDETLKINSINLSNSPVLRELEQHGYMTKVSLAGFRKMFPRRYQSEDAIYNKAGTAELFWNSISLLCESNQLRYILLPIENTHPPYVSYGLTEENIFDRPLRGAAALKETDKQIEFYMDMFGENTVKMIFSDHGGYWNGTLAYFWPRQHVFLSIFGGGYSPRRVKGLCSSIDFYKIMEQIINGDEIQEDALIREYVEIQGVPTVSKRVEIKESDTLPQAVPTYYPVFRGYKGIVTDEYVYIHFGGGIEWMSRRDRLQPRPSWYTRPDDICDIKLLPEMREKAGIDYGNEPQDYGPMSSYYKTTLKAYNDNYAYNEKKLILINDLVASMSEYAMALYLGDTGSRELYLTLSLENRKKIICIIDENSNCTCADLDVPVIPIEKVARHDVRYILVTSRTFPDELKDFLHDYGQIIQVFGLYGWFEINGYHTKHNFYDFAIQSKDAPLPSSLVIPDFLHYASPNCFCEVAVAMIVQDEKTLLSRLHDILKQTVLGIRIYCLDFTGKAADIVKEYQKIDSCIEVIPVGGYSSLSSKLNELISSVNSKYLFFLAADEYLHARGLFYLHEIAEQTEADVVAAGAVLRAVKKVKPGLADFAEGAFELKREARILATTFKERSAELNETEIPNFAGNKMYRVDFLRKYGIRFQDIKSGWKDIFCLQTIFGAPKYVKAVSPVCISSGNTTGVALEDNSAEYARKLVESMFAYQQAIEAMLKQWGGFGNNPLLCDAFRERAMTIFDQQYFSGIALNDEISKSVSQAVQEELQKNPSIGMWWIKYLFMRSSFPQSV